MKPITMHSEQQKQEIESRKSELRQAIREKKQALQRAPEGRLRISAQGETPRFYHVVETGDHTGRYISVKEQPLARKLAQKAYDLEVLRLAQEELDALEQWERRTPARVMEEVYDSLSPLRQSLVAPLVQTDEEFLREWESVTWDKDWYRKEKPSYPTNRGEMTRSRIEALIADMLDRNGWPYRYEYPIRLDDGERMRVYHPDFMILDVRNRREILLEHFGLLHVEEYRRQMIEKLQRYEQNGYREGVDIIYTFECEEKPLDLNYLEQRLQRLLG